jgi:hypothetical protein
MANEPERPIEQWLRAAAKKRRDEAGAPFELHPADRRLLQGELARQFAKGQATARPPLPFLVRLWPRLAWAAAILAVLLVGVSLLLPGPAKRERLLLAGNKEMKQAQVAKELQALPTAPLAGKDNLLAKSEDREREKLALPPIPALDNGAAAGAPMAASGGLLQSSRAAVAGSSFQRSDKFGAAPAPVAPGSALPAAPSAPVAAPSPAPMVAASEAPSTLHESLTTAPSSKSLAAVASANRPKTPWATDAVATSAAALEKNNLGVAQRFVQVMPAPGAKAAFADKAKAAQPVLVSFDVEQAGPELRLTDNDGSVYKGYVQVADAVQPGRRSRTEAPASVRTAKVANGALEQEAAANLTFDQLGPQNYAFRVSGTNRTLHKKVVFTGNLIAATNIVVLPQGATNVVTGNLGATAPANSAQPPFLPLFNSRISGKVVVGSGKAVQIEALPANP